LTAALAGVMILINERRRILPLIRNSLKAIILFSFASLLLYFTFKEMLNTSRLDRVWQWAFELFINYSESGSLNTSSSQKMSEMIRLPQSASTWWFGDGMIISEDGSYYKQIDIGVLRLLYYFGVLGILAFLISQIMYVKI